VEIATVRRSDLESPLIDEGATAIDFFIDAVWWRPDVAFEPFCMLIPYSIELGIFESVRAILTLKENRFGSPLTGSTRTMPFQNPPFSSVNCHKLCVVFFMGSVLTLDHVTIGGP